MNTNEYCNTIYAQDIILYFDEKEGNRDENY